MNQNNFFNDRSLIVVKSTLTRINKNITNHYGFQTNDLLISESIRDQIILDLELAKSRQRMKVRIPDLILFILFDFALLLTEYHYE